MAGILGRRGVVKVSGNTIAGVSSFSYSEKADSIDATVMGDTGKVYLTGLPDGSGTVECRFVNTDYAATGEGQGTALGVLKTGTQVTLQLIADSAVTTGEFVGLSGSTCVITSYDYNQSYDGIPTCTFGFQGVLTKYSG